MQLEPAEPQEIPIKEFAYCVVTQCQISYIETVEEKSKFSCIRLIYPNVQLQAC